MSPDSSSLSIPFRRLANSFLRFLERLAVSMIDPHRIDAWCALSRSPLKRGFLFMHFLSNVASVRVGGGKGEDIAV